ncbi:uncharacterized protein [Choristoneura fumiferana]|uniref:uncharacterized protein n=1 Tax=Choristoneura fumiferana TaxID=7141 RepID=UPI003D155288
MRVYKTVIRPVLMYGCEAWTLTLKEENKLLVAERKIYRKILGPTRQVDGAWRVRRNVDVEDLVGEPNIIGESKSARLRWLGHVERMGEDPMPYGCSWSVGNDSSFQRDVLFVSLRHPDGLFVVFPSPALLGGHR